jgi:cellulose synthase/poly-beta-1,6-N-acetylglucosamine synthase-like glycosyltransferase
MVVRWFFYSKTIPAKPKAFDKLPKITVQIPLYNERLVAKRIVNTIAKLTYPTDRLQIQIVDDSDDDTSTIIAERVAYYQKQGINIQHVQRANRQGFKAGALKDAMVNAQGEFIAIFDADFIPDADILINNIHYFTQSTLGMLQFRWEHLNRRSSLLTKTQAIMLDAHFGLEQQVRCASGMLFNFNGTGGIWRKSTIIDAGNWSADTLTEDLDLSYRAQLTGWKMLYLNNITCPGELPADMNAFKSQQYRWAKGGVQVMMKMFSTVWRAKLSFSKKIESTFHLSNNLAYLVMLIDTLFFLVPSLYLRDQYDWVNIWWLDITLLFLSSGGHLIYLYSGQLVLGRSKSRALLKIPSLMILGIQLAINNSRAGLEALLGKESEFVRTPKTGELHSDKLHSVTLSSNVFHSSNDLHSCRTLNCNHAHEPTKKSLLLSEVKDQLYKATPPKGALFELLIAFVYFIVLLWAIENKHWFMLPFIALLAVGFVTTAINSMFHYYKLSK